MSRVTAALRSTLALRTRKYLPTHEKNKWLGEDLQGRSRIICKELLTDLRIAIAPWCFKWDGWDGNLPVGCSLLIKHTDSKHH